MPADAKPDSDDASRPVRDPAADRLIHETDEMIRNTRRFLDGLRESNEQAQAYVRQIKDSLERDVDRLRRKRDAADAADEPPSRPELEE